MFKNSTTSHFMPKAINSRVLGVGEFGGFASMRVREFREFESLRVLQEKAGDVDIAPRFAALRTLLGFCVW